MGITPRDSWSADRSNTTILEMIYAKYGREYLPFFANLLSVYSGNVDAVMEIREVVVWIHRARSIIEIFILSGRVAGDRAADLYDLFDKIEERKSYFLGDVEKNQAMRQRMNEVTDDVGVSPDDLSLTKKVLTAGIKQTRRKSGGMNFGRMRPGVGEHLKRFGEGMKTAAFGPFTPIVDLANDFEKLIRSQFDRRRERKEQGIVSGLGSSGLTSGFESSDYAVPIRGGVPVYGGESPQLMQDQLFQFFNSKAYKAKWTKELLDQTKKGTGAAGTRGGGLTDILKLLTGAAILATGKKLYDLLEARKEAKKSGGEALESAGRLGTVSGRMIAEGQHFGAQEMAMKHGISPQEFIERAVGAEHTRQTGLAAGFKAREPAIAKIPGINLLVKAITGYDREKLQKVQSKEELREEYSRKFGYTPAKVDTAELNRIVEATGKELNKLSKSVDKLSDNVGKNTRTEPKPISVGNPWDSADILINALAAGGLTIGGN